MGRSVTGMLRPARRRRRLVVGRWGQSCGAGACGPDVAAGSPGSGRRRRCRGPSAAGRPAASASSAASSAETRAACGRSSRVVRSNAAPAGSTWRTTPLASSGSGPLRLVGVGDQPLRVEDRHRAAADDAQHLVAVLDGDRGAGVLVDADPEQLGRLRHDHQQPAVAVALVEVLVDDRRAQQARARPRPGSSAAWGSRRRRRTRPCGTTGCWRRPRCRPRRRRARGRATIASPERRAADDRGQLELVAAGHEDAGRARRASATRSGSCASLAALGPHGRDLAGAQPPEQRVVHLDDLVAEARRGGDRPRSARRPRRWPPRSP